MHRLESSARAAVTTLLGVIALAAFITVARAEPFHAVDPNLVLLRIARADPNDELKASERRYRDEPSLTSALGLAGEQIDRGRRTSEARYFGRAQAILESWRAQAAASPDWHVLLADIHQYRHDYPHALTLLDRAIALDQRQVRARLMRAAIHQTRGDFDSAQSDCRTLLALAESALGVVCLAQVKSVTGELDRAHALLERQLAADAGRATDAATRVWMLAALAEMADRRGEVSQAEQLLREALRLKPHDLFIRLTLADLLLTHGRAQDANELIDHQATSPVLLLRRAEALRAAGRDADALIAGLRQAIAEGSERGERIDGRVMARLRLLENSNCEALAAARENWRTQRESADVRLLLVTSQACADPAATRELTAWRAATRYEDAFADALLAAGGRRT